MSTFIVSDFLFGSTRRTFFSEIYESVQSVFLAPAVLSTLRNPRKPAFKVTPKGMGMQQEQLNALSFFFFAILCLNRDGRRLRRDAHLGAAGVPRDRST